MSESPEIGHNSEAESSAFERAMRKQVAMNAERAEMNARHRKARKQMKADGIVLGKLDAVVKMLDWSPAEIRDDLDVTVRYMRYAGFNIGSLAEGDQIDLFGNFGDEEVAAADWKARGRADALRLKPAKPPKECPPEYVDAYLEGHGEAKWWTDDAPFGRGSSDDGDDDLEPEGGDWDGDEALA